MLIWAKIKFERSKKKNGLFFWGAVKVRMGERALRVKNYLNFGSCVMLIFEREKNVIQPPEKHISSIWFLLKYPVCIRLLLKRPGVCRDGRCVLAFLLVPRLCRRWVGWWERDNSCDYGSWSAFEERGDHPQPVGAGAASSDKSIAECIAKPVSTHVISHGNLSYTDTIPCVVETASTYAISHGHLSCTDNTPSIVETVSAHAIYQLSFLDQ